MFATFTFMAVADCCSIRPDGRKVSNCRSYDLFNSRKIEALELNCQAFENCSILEAICTLFAIESTPMSQVVNLVPKKIRCQLQPFIFESMVCYD